MKAFAPNGNPILGTYERCPARANTVEDSFERQLDGSLTYEHTGYTEMFYDGQETVSGPNREVIFLDEEGNEWPESKLELRP